MFAGVVGSDRTASALSDLADEFVTYRQLLEGEAPQPLAISRPVTVPPLRVARGFRRPGEGLSGMSPSSQAMSRIAPPTIVVNTPSMPTQSTASSSVLSPENLLDDDSSAASRRRRRGGRRRRGAETLAIVGSDASDTNEAQELAGPPAPEVPTVAPQPGAPSASRGSRSSDTTRPQVATPIARPIVAPMIAPRPFRTRANDGLSPLAGRPQPVLITPSVADDPTNPVDVSDAPTSDLEIAPPELQPAVVEPRSVTPATTMPSAPRVQLPGERLRRFVAPPPATEAIPSQITSAPVEAVSATDTPLSEGEPETHVAAAEEITPLKDSEVAEPVASSADEVEVDGDGTDLTTAASVGTPRPRRRRGGRPVRGAGSPGDAELEPVAQVGEVPTIELVPEPSPSVDAVEASDSAPDGRPRGRRRGSRPREIA